MTQFAVFFVPLENGSTKLEEMNAFLRSHSVVEVESHFIREGWGFCVEWSDGVPESENRGGSGRKQGEKPDYSVLLPPDAYARFQQLRKRRMEIAKAEGVAAYIILTDAQMAEVAKLEHPTLSQLFQIPSIGESRIKLYGEKLLSRSIEMKDNDACPPESIPEV